MKLPEVGHRVWNDLIRGELDLQFEFLGLKVLLTRIRMSVQSSNQNAAITDYEHELWNVFNMNIHVDKVQKDLSKIIEAVNKYHT